MGGFSWYSDHPAVLFWSGSGPTIDGRLKPELIAPAFVFAGDTDFQIGEENCNSSTQGGTSWSGPLIAGAAALVRQYYREGYIDGGGPSDRGFAPSSALIKATLVAAATPALFFDGADGTYPIEPVPSYQQGFGMPVLDDVLPLSGDPEALWVKDMDSLILREGETIRYQFDVGEARSLRIVLAWVDPPGTGSAQPANVSRLVNDLDLRVVGPDGEVHLGNASLGSSPDRLNNLESVELRVPAAGRYTVMIDAHSIGAGGSQGAALVVSGDLEPVTGRQRSVRRR